MDTHGPSFIPLLLVVGLAFVVPLLLARFRRVPVVVGEIGAGILIGRSGLGLVTEEPTLNLLAEIGFALLMFLSGLEIDFSLIFRSSLRDEKFHRHSLGMGLISFLVTLALAGLIGILVVSRGLARDPWMMALILSTTSLGVVVPVLKERRLSSGEYGQSLLLAALLADFLTMFLITVYVAVLSLGVRLEILLVGLLFLAFLLAYRLGVRGLQRPSVRRIFEELSGATSQIKVRGALALMLAFVVLAEFLGVELILGAFLAGAVISLLSSRAEEELHSKLDAMGFGFFIPLFFIVVGINFDLPALLGDQTALLLTPLLLAAAFLIKFLAALIFKGRFSWRQTIGGGFLLSARLSLIIAASAVGLRMGVISEATNASMILIAALTSTIAPLLFNGLVGDEPGRVPRRYLIFGAANLGVQVAKELLSHGERVCFVESDPKLIKLASKEGFEIIQSNGTGLPLEKTDLKGIEALIALNGKDDRNLEICRQAAALGMDHIISIVHDAGRIPEFHALGIQTFVPALYRPILLALMARNPDMFELLTSTRDDRDVREVHMRNPNLAGKPISTVILPGDSLILTIGRNGEVLIPHGSTRLEYNDRLTILGDLRALEDVKMLLDR